jgi:transcriptional regulator with XRE-family HTH domain
MATKAQHSAAYQPLMALLRELREGAGLTQRDLGKLLGKPQSWIYNCEVGNRRVDVAELAAWAIACGVDPEAAFARFLRSGTSAAKPPRKAPRKGSA